MKTIEDLIVRILNHVDVDVETASLCGRTIHAYSGFTRMCYDVKTSETTQEELFSLIEYDENLFNEFSAVYDQFTADRDVAFLRDKLRRLCVELREVTQKRHPPEA